jgi:hypothetical protein
MRLWNKLLAVVTGVPFVVLAVTHEGNRRRTYPDADLPDADLLRRYLPNRDHARRIDHIRGLNLDEEIPPSDQFRRVSIECSMEPLFRCPICAEDLRNEQASIIASILGQYPEASLIASSHKITNAVYMYFPLTEENDQAVDQFVISLPGVQKLHPGEDFHANKAEVVEYIGANDARETYCVTGKGVRVAV